MQDSDVRTPWEERFDAEAHEIANMDELDFMTLLMESRIIQAP